MLRCDGWRTVYCPGVAYRRLTWAYRGAAAWPSSYVFCSDCLELALDMLEPLHENGDLAGFTWEAVNVRPGSRQ